MNSIELTTIYDPFTNSYKIKAGEYKVEVPAYFLTQEHLDDLAAVLKGIDDDNKIKAALDTWVKAVINSNGDYSTWKVELCGKPRYLSKSSELIIDDVIKLLDDYKGLNVKKVYMSKKPSSKFGSEIYLGLISDMPQKRTEERLLQIYMDHRVFDRTHKMDIDKEAGLAAKLDIDTYIALRIAFLIYKSLKVDQEETVKINLDGFRVIGRYDRPKSL